jgi:hypothetical protein
MRRNAPFAALTPMMPNTPKTRLRPMTLWQVFLPWLAASLAGCACVSAWAQSSCSSDGRVPPQTIVERFTSADCAACWRDPATSRVGKGELAVDWIVPTPRGDDAPLSAVASRDALQRLAELQLAAPSTLLTHRQAAPHRAKNPKSRLRTEPGFKLRVARGVALGGYMGASIELELPRQQRPGQLSAAYPLSAWLLLVEEIPQGAEGSPVDRLLVRNALLTFWKPSQRLLEARPMSLPEGSNPERLRVVGWVQDTNGQTLARAASQCD